MQSEAAFAKMADACIHAGRLVQECGSPALRKAMQVVLFILGREIAAHGAQRDAGPRDKDRGTH